MPMMSPSDDDSDLGQYAPGLDGDGDRRLRYQEKLKDADDLRRQREVKSKGPSDIFDFGVRQKERRIAVEISSEDEEEEKMPERRRTPSASSTKKRPRRRNFSTELSDTSDSDVVEISTPSNRSDRSSTNKNKKVQDPLLKRIDFDQLCSANNIRQAQDQNPELRRSMAIVAETSKLIAEIRAPIVVQPVPITPDKDARPQRLPDLIKLDNVVRNGQDNNSNGRVKICLRILDPDLQVFTYSYMWTDSAFAELYKKISQYFGKIWLTIDGLEIERNATPSGLRLEDGTTVQVVTARPSLGLYTVEKEEKGGAEGISINFCVASGKQEICMKVSAQDTFGKIRERLCAKHGFDKVVFLMDGDRISESDTVADHDLEDADQIDIKIS